MSQRFQDPSRSNLYFYGLAVPRLFGCLRWHYDCVAITWFETLATNNYAISNEKFLTSMDCLL